MNAALRASVNAESFYTKGARAVVLKSAVFLADFWPCGANFFIYAFFAQKQVSQGFSAILPFLPPPLRAGSGEGGSELEKVILSSKIRSSNQFFFMFEV